MCPADIPGCLLTLCNHSLYLLNHDDHALPMNFYTMVLLFLNAVTLKNSQNLMIVVVTLFAQLNVKYFFISVKNI